MPRDLVRRTGTKLRALAVGCLALGMSGCEGPRLGGAAIVLASLDRFAREVEPHLEARCAQGGCHGRPERPFALYAPGQNRRDPARTYLDEPLQRIEIEQNAQRVAALGLGGSPATSPVLRKPLALRAGGSWHGGGDVFVDASDPGYLAILGWLEQCEQASDGGVP